MLQPQVVASVADGLLHRTAGEWDLVQQTSHSVVIRSDGLIAKHHGSRRPSFEAEWRGLHYLQERVPGFAPEPLAASPNDSVLVMTDLGGGPSLADVLLGRNEAEAIRYLDAYVDAVAQLHEGTWEEPNPPDGLEADRPLSHFSLYSTALERIGQNEALGDRATRSEVLEEIEPLIRLTTATEATVFTLGDMCPGNQIMTPTGVRFIDLEACGFMSPALDVTYLTIPFPSCWCAWDLPEHVRTRALNRYLEQVPEPDLVMRDLAAAEVLWTAIYCVAFLNMDEDTDNTRPAPDGSRPGLPEVVAHRLDRVRLNQSQRTRFPAFCELLDRLRAQVDSTWGVIPPLEPAPAFRRGKR